MKQPTALGRELAVSESIAQRSQREWDGSWWIRFSVNTSHWARTGRIGESIAQRSQRGMGAGGFAFW